MDRNEILAKLGQLHAEAMTKWREADDNDVLRGYCGGRSAAYQDAMEMLKGETDTEPEPKSTGLPGVSEEDVAKLALMGMTALCYHARLSTGKWSSEYAADQAIVDGGLFAEKMAHELKRLFGDG